MFGVSVFGVSVFGVSVFGVSEFGASPTGPPSVISRSSSPLTTSGRVLAWVSSTAVSLCAPQP